MNKKERKELILYRLEQSFDKENEIISHINNGYYSTAVNRIYYSIYYSITALAILYKFETSKHKQLIGWFNKEFVHKGVFDKDLSKIAIKLFEKRNKGDYEPFIEFEKDEVLIMYSEMKEFIETIKSFVNSKIDNT